MRNHLSTRPFANKGSYRITDAPPGLDIIAVDPNHQRKGIGKMLMEWGEERAAKQHKNIRFMASTAGAKMYRALGYEEVGALDILGGMEHSFIKKRA